MKHIASILLMTLLLTASACTEYQYQGATAGGAIGGITGAILDSRNPWRGGIIGAALGAIAGATIADISVRGSHEVYESGRPIEYRTENGRGMYRADPYGDVYSPDSHTRCRRIHERVWEDGRQVSDHIKEICQENSYERRY